MNEQPDRIIPIDLLAAARLGELTAEQATELSALLRENPDARREYSEHLLLSADLCWERTAQRLAAPVPASSAEPTPDPSNAKVRMPLRFAPVGYALVAALLLAAAAFAIYVLASANPESSTPSLSSAPIATLVGATESVFVDDEIANPGSEYPAGRYGLDSGSASFLLRNRVAVDVRGKTRLVMRNPMHATLSIGSAAFNCPATATGYTVDAPGGVRIRDLGTRFLVRVDESGQTFVRVIEGRVSVALDSGVSALLAAGDAALAHGETRQLVRADDTLLAGFTDRVSILGDPADGRIDSFGNPKSIDRPASPYDRLGVAGPPEQMRSSSLVYFFKLPDGFDAAWLVDGDIEFGLMGIDGSPEFNVNAHVIDLRSEPTLLASDYAKGPDATGTLLQRDLVTPVDPQGRVGLSAEGRRNLIRYLAAEVDPTAGPRYLAVRLSMDRALAATELGTEPRGYRFSFRENVGPIDLSPRLRLNLLKQN